MECRVCLTDNCTEQRCADLLKNIQKEFDVDIEQAIKELYPMADYDWENLDGNKSKFN